MKPVRLASFLIMLGLLAALVPVASAAGPTGTWVTGIACVNMGSAATTQFSVSFYPQNSATAALVYNDPNPIPAGGSRNYYTPSSPPGVPSPFTGSAVVTSDQPVSCNVNTQTTGTGTATSPYRVDTSKGVPEVDAKPALYAPQVMKSMSGTWSSYISVQNTDAAAAAVTLTYKDRNGADVPAATEHSTIPAQSNKVFYQADNPGLPAGFLGAAKIVSDNGTSKLAGVVAMYNAGTSNTDAQFLTYNTVGAGAPRLLVPRIVRNYYGYNGGLSIQNVGAGSTSVTITFHFAGNTYTYSRASLAPGAALALYAPSITELNPVDLLGQSSRFGSAEIQAGVGGSLAAIVNEDNRGGAGIPVERVGQGATYNAITDGTQTNTIFFAQVTRKAGGVYSGGFQVSNTTSAATTCNISYAGAPAATETSVPLAANGSLSRYAPSVNGLPDGYNSSVTVTCGQPVVGISNLAVYVGSGRLGDSFAQVVGANTP